MSVLHIEGPLERRPIPLRDLRWQGKVHRRVQLWRAKSWVRENGVATVVFAALGYGLGMWAAFHLGAPAETLRSWAALGVPLLAGAGFVVWGASLELGRK